VRVEGSALAIGYLYLEEAEFRYTTRELTTGDELESLAIAALAFGDTLPD
jgi:hypothetical protein